MNTQPPKTESQVRIALLTKQVQELKKSNELAKHLSTQIWLVFWAYVAFSFVTGFFASLGR